MSRRIARHAILTLLALAGAGCMANDAEQPGLNPRQGQGMEQSELNGDWKVVSCEVGGMAQPSNIGKKLEIRDGRLRMEGPKSTIVYDYKTVESVTPKRIILTLVGFDINGRFEPSPMEAPAASGIYEVTATELKICWSEPDQPVPDSFSTESHPTCTLNVFKRISQTPPKRE